MTNAIEDLLDVAPHIHLFNEVHTEFFRRSAFGGESDACCEELYFILYVDIQQHPAIYMEAIFEMNDIYAERCAGIMGVLAKILRNKGKPKSCLHVLQLQGQILKKYQALAMPRFDITGTEDANSNTTKNRTRSGRNRRINRAQIKCCRALTYKYNDLRIDVHSQMASAAASTEDAVAAKQNTQKNAASAVEALREACQYELEEKYDFEQQKWLVVLFSIVGPDYESMTQADIRALKDDQLWQALMHQSRNSGVVSGPTYDVEMRKCHGCDRIEKHSRGEFEECSKCFKVSYCSFECQKAHWKVHKKECVKPKWSPRSALSFPWMS